MDISVPPAGSGITLNRRPDGLTIDVNSPKLSPAVKSLIPMAAFWWVLILLPTLIMIGAFRTGSKLHFKGGADLPPWFLTVFLIPFWIVGLWMAAGVLRTFTRRAHIEIVGKPGHTLRVTERSLCGTRAFEWPNGMIDSINMENLCNIGSHSLHTLQVLSVDGTKRRFLFGLDWRLLQWIELVLCDELKKPTTTEKRFRESFLSSDYITSSMPPEQNEGGSGASDNG